MQILKGFFFPFSTYTHGISLFLQEIIKIQGCRKVEITEIKNCGINKRATSNFTGMKISWEGVVKLA